MSFIKLGLTFGDAVNLFLSKVSIEQKTPFSISSKQKKHNNDFLA